MGLQISGPLPATSFTGMPCCLETPSVVQFIVTSRSLRVPKHRNPYSRKKLRRPGWYGLASRNCRVIPEYLAIPCNVLSQRFRFYHILHIQPCQFCIAAMFDWNCAVIFCVWCIMFKIVRRQIAYNVLCRQLLGVSSWNVCWIATGCICNGRKETAKIVKRLWPRRFSTAQPSARVAYRRWFRIQEFHLDNEK